MFQFLNIINILTKYNETNTVVRFIIQFQFSVKKKNVL